ncbi:hypothetical protein PR048_019750 [Dryococelus australis]|uniref:DDE-1 domain-containing protein n=1 Tax=Dryococelus australis TaxID=614101 RepID=A0ABQ9H4F1_9NEOP|nr:hypothetical protein PR048_019750 [Dryococelus australis]
MTSITTVTKAGFPKTETELLVTFLKLHSNITSRRAQNPTTNRASVQRNLFQDENKYENRLEQPGRVFKFDESAFFLNAKGKKVLCVKEEKNVSQQVTADEKECITVLVTGNANGDLAPTLVFFKYERVSHELADSVPNTTVSENLRLKIPLPVIVFVDGHASHFTLHTSKLCEDHAIMLIALLPN